MNKQTGTYLLGRIHKFGELNDKELKKTIVSSSTVESHGNSWTFIESYGHEKFVFAKLVKFKSTGEVYVIDEKDKKQDKLIEQNLRIAVSPFIYIPAFSGVCYLKVSNHIHEINFPNIFTKIIKETNDDFFVDCNVKHISDLRSFSKRVISLSTFERIFANINPPNPLFGPHWKKLKEYLEHRNSDSLTFDEKSGHNESLNSKLREHLNGIINQSEKSPYIPEEPIDITDAAILMAADGYGKGYIIGKEKNNYITVKTDQAINNFKFNIEPDPEELYRIAYDHFIKLNDERNLNH